MHNARHTHTSDLGFTTVPRLYIYCSYCDILNYALLEIPIVHLVHYKATVGTVTLFPDSDMPHEVKISKNTTKQLYWTSNE